MTRSKSDWRFMSFSKLGAGVLPFVPCFECETREILVTDSLYQSKLPNNRLQNLRVAQYLEIISRKSIIFIIFSVECYVDIKYFIKVLNWTLTVTGATNSNAEKLKWKIDLVGKQFMFSRKYFLFSDIISECWLECLRVNLVAWHS